MEFNIDEVIMDSFPDGFGDRSYQGYEPVSNLYPIVYPHVRMEENNTKAFLEFNLADSEAWEEVSRMSRLSSKTSTALFQRNENGYDTNKIVHDFTFGCLTQTTDIKLETFIKPDSVPPGKRHLLAKTPDYLTEQEGHLVLVEFGTCGSNNPRILDEYYDVKKDTYSSTMDSLKDHIKCKYLVFVIIVGPMGIVTNMNLSSELKTALVYRYKVVKAIDDGFYDTGLKIRPIDATLSEEIIKFQKVLNDMDLRGVDEYSPENYNKAVKTPADKLAISQVIAHGWKESMKYVEDRNWFVHKAKGTRESFSLAKISAITAKHYQKCQDMAPDGFNNHMKSVVNMPMVILRSGVLSLSLKSSRFMTESWSTKGSDEVLRLWIQAKEAAQGDDFIDNSEDSDAFEDLVSDPEYLKFFIQDQPTIGVKPSETRSLYSRVKLEISKDDAIELAKVGVQGKKLDNAKEPAVIDYRREKQKPFSYMDANTADIDDLIFSDLSWMLNTEICEGNESNSLTVVNLIEMAHNIHGKNELTSKYDEHLRELVMTPIFQWASLVSDIAFELCLALRQSCKRDVFIIKKLKNFQCYVLIKPVRLSSKIFFSLFWFNDDVLFTPDYVGNVFKQPRSNGEVSWTDFVSLDQCKIENWALAESRTFAMIPYWLEFHSLPPFKLDATGEKEIGHHINALQMMMFYTLIEIADKSEIEQEASLFRYMFMKSLTARPLIPEPELVIEDFKPNPRSRLTVWIQRKLTQYCVYVAEDRIQIFQEDLLLHDQSLSTASTKRMIWKGLINPYNGAALKNPGDAVNLMYIGYVQNKNLQPEANVFGHMLKKILILEDDFTEEIQDRIGREDKPLGSKTSHEYNVNLLKEATLFAKNSYIPNLHAENGLKATVEDTFKTICNTYVEDVFTTLKASSNFDEKFFVLTEEEYHRAKVIEKAQLYVHDKSTKIIDILLTCQQEVDRNGYMRIDIFQKNQHGGIREIYVLGFAERVVQWFIETLARGLCNLFPGETMTHPENKKKLPDEYFKNLRTKNGGRPTMTVATSADASKWSQNMYPHKFAVMLCLLLPEYLHPIIWNSLAFWKNKYIMIPQSLIKRMHMDDNMQFYNEYMEGLYKSYKGVEETSWAKEGQAFILVKTGMMQGILHYTSSLFHSIMNVYIEALSMKYFNQITGMQLEPLILQSSDDSCEILSCEIQETNLARIVSLYCLCVVLYFKSVMGAEVAIKNSDKKTAFNLEQCFEFNSAYHFGPSRYESDIKMLSSSLICTDRENMVDRHMEQYTQLTNFINAGGSIYTANFIQMAQALFNYRLLGSSVTSRFSILAKAYESIPDPNLGFFALDNPLFTGLCGYKYNLWKIITSTEVGKTYKYYLNEALKPSDRNKKPDLISTKNGLLAKRAILGFGNRQKLLAIIERMSLPEDWQELMDADPSLYFRNAQDEEEFKIKCALKMFSPGVQESLSTGNITTRIMASSAYITISTVMRSLGDWQSKESLNLNEFKLSDRYNLLQLVAHELDLLLTEIDDISMEELNFLFPYQDEYLALESKLALCDYTIPKPKIIEYRRVITEVRVFDRDNITALPPDRIMAAIWFRDNPLVKKPRYSFTYLYDCYLRLKRVIPWLDEDLEKTLQEGPFDHINSLAAWLSQYHQKDKVVVIIGAPIVCRRGSSSILAVIRQNFHKQFEIENRIHETVHMTSNDFTAVRQSILMAMSFPSESVDLERRVYQILDSSLSHGMTYNPSAVRSRYNTLCIMRDAVTEAVSATTTLERIAECKIGIVGGYLFPQALDLTTYQFHGEGTWVGKFYDRKVQIEVDSYYDESIKKHITYITRLMIDDIYPTQDILFCIKSWLDEHHVVDKIPKDLARHHLERTRSIAIAYARRAKLTAGIKAYYVKGRFCDDITGVPIIINKDLHVNFGRWTKFKLDIPVDRTTGISRGVIKLMGEASGLTYSGAPKWVTLARYVVHHKDYEGRGKDGMFSFPMSVPYKAWLQNYPLEKMDAITLINYAIQTENTHLKEHVRDMLRASFSKRNYRLGKKRDEMPLIKTAYKQYVTVVESKGGSPSKRVPNIPSVHELLKEPQATVSKPPTRVRWADEEEAVPKTIEDFQGAGLEAIDKASLMKVVSEEEEDHEAQGDSPIESDDGSASADEDSDIDWGSDDSDILDKVKSVIEDIKREGITYESIDREGMAPDSDCIKIDLDLDFGAFDDDLDAYLGDTLFKDLEMFNSSDYHITQSVNETNMRTNMVKREHCWFDEWMDSWLRGHDRDFSLLFHYRTVTAWIKKEKFMEIMEFIYPNITFTEEIQEVHHVSMPNVVNPFDKEE